MNGHDQDGLNAIGPSSWEPVESEIQPQRHTPGPWEVQKSQDGSLAITGAYHIPKGAPAVCGGLLHVCNLSGDIHHDEANASLIAAAPDLLQACKQAQCSCAPKERESGHTSDCWFPAMQTAISKAEGNL